MSTLIRQKQIESITAINQNNAVENGALSINKLEFGVESTFGSADNVTAQEVRQLKGVSANIQVQLSNKLAKNVLKNIDTVDWSNDDIAATAAAIANKIASDISTAIGNVTIENGLKYKGAWSAIGTPTTSNPIKIGYVYTFDSGTAPAGVVLEAGDVLTATANITSASGVANAANWIVTQANINGAVTTNETLTENTVMVGNGGKMLKKSSNTYKLIKMTAGVLEAAGLNIVLNNGSAGSIDEMINFVQSGNITLSWDDTNKKLTISGAYPTISNGTGNAGQYISAISISNGIITPTFATLPTSPQGVVLQSNLVYNEEMTRIDNTTYETQRRASLATLRVYVNGVRQKLNTDYTVSNENTTVTRMTWIGEFMLEANIDNVTCDYIKG